VISHTEARVGPRGFDADEALDSAMRIFWERGYEGASLADLTGAMKINRTSMYAAFGNKEQLFQQVLQRYTEGPASYGARALQQATAREVATAFLNGSVRATTSPISCESQRYVIWHHLTTLNGTGRGERTLDQATQLGLSSQFSQLHGDAVAVAMRPCGHLARSHCSNYRGRRQSTGTRTGCGYG